MVQMIRLDVRECYAEQGRKGTASEYGVEAFVTPTEPLDQFVDRCVSAELDRCYA
jgi:hypothetical protein